MTTVETESNLSMTPESLSHSSAILDYETIKLP